MADVAVKPAFQSAIADSGDVTKLGPNAWNAARLFTGGAAGESVVADAASATGASWANRSRVLTVGITQTGTPASLVETDLWSYTMAGATLNTDGRGLRISVFGTTGANGNSKTLRLYFGATVLSGNPTAGNGLPWSIRADLLRTGATTQVANALLNVGNATSFMQTGSTPAETLANPVIIRCTGQNAVASANDIVVRAAMVELLN